MAGSREVQGRGQHDQAVGFGHLAAGGWVAGLSPTIPGCRSCVWSKGASDVGPAFNANPLSLSTWKP